MRGVQKVRATASVLGKAGKAGRVPAARAEARRAKPSVKPDRPAVAQEVSGLVESGSDDLKSGCLFCPLFPFTSVFDKHADSYGRDASKILEKNKEGHAVQSHCVSEPWTKVRVLFVGEAPGKHEDKQGRPFVGGSGGLLRKTIDAVSGLRPEDYGFANIVSCRPPNNRSPNRTEVKSCSPQLIRQIHARQPEVVVVLGNTAMDFLAGQTGITTFAGRVLPCVRPEFPDLKIVACLHPAYVLRMDHEIDKFVEAIETVGKVVRGEHKPKSGLGEYVTLTDAQDVADLIDEFIETGDPVAFDTETGGLSPFQTQFPRLLCLSISNEEGTGWTIPYDHADSPFKSPGRARRIVTDALKKLLLSGLQKVTHNGSKFDRNHILAGLGIVPTKVHDTLHMHFVIDERRGTHGLDDLAHLYTGMGGYDKPLNDYKEQHAEADPDRGGSYANIPGDVLFPYAAMDADVDLRVYNAIRRDPEWKDNPRLHRIALEFYPRLADTLAQMEFDGARVDPKMVAFLDRKYSRETKVKLAEIQRDPCVKQFVADRKFPKNDESFNPESWQQLGKVLFGYYKLRPIELTDSGLTTFKNRYENVLSKWNDSAGKKIGGGRGKPKFDDVVQAAIDAKEWEFFSTKADVLQEFGRMGNPLVSKILAYREVTTLHGTFVKPLQTKLDADNNIHGNYLIHGTVTARLASRDPNLQNIPNKGGGTIKRCYVSRFGSNGVLLQSDYSQVELRFAACWFNEPTMIDAYVRGDDLHMLTAIDISHLSKDRFLALNKDDQKGWRTRAKRVNFGVLYGGGPSALVMTLRKDGVFITYDEAEELIAAYFEARPGLRKGMDKLMERAKKDGFLESFTGHRRRVPEVFSQDEKIVARALRQSVNFPVQNGAAQMTNMSAVLIREWLAEMGLRTKLILTVHDSLVLDTHVDELHIVAPKVKHIMENIATLSAKVLPGLDWSWLRVPIVADLESGFDWGSGVEWSKLGIDANNIDVDKLWPAMEVA